MIRTYAFSLIALVSFSVLAILVYLGINEPSSDIIDLDYQLFNSLNDVTQSETIKYLMVWMSSYGREVVWSITIAIFLIFGKSSSRKLALILSLAILVLIPLGILTKEIIHRPRPLTLEFDSFPSGHTLIVTAGATVLLSLFNKSNKQIAISIALAIEAALVSISRIYVGAHYPLDVLGGVLLGVGVALFFVGSKKYFEQFYHSHINR